MNTMCPTSAIVPVWLFAGIASALAMLSWSAAARVLVPTSFRKERRSSATTELLPEENFSKLVVAHATGASLPNYLCSACDEHSQEMAAAICAGCALDIDKSEMTLLRSKPKSLRGVSARERQPV